jgi:dimethylhistidine N-methyltransferase
MKIPNAASQAADVNARFRLDFLEGMSQPQKRIPCKYLYDDEGARLFEAICELDEYYPTRAETRILRDNLPEIAALIGPQRTIVELGSGSGVKTRLLLDALDTPVAYIPIDVSRKQLLESSDLLARDFPELQVLPLCADFTDDFALPRPEEDPAVIFFPGSTLGNFEPDQAEMFLERMAALIGSEGALLLGVDLKKDHALLHRAYNDAQGVTAAFNLNLLARANRELDADFDLSRFRHEALYNPDAGRIEMHLVSLQPHPVWIGDRKFSFSPGESICTEHSYKYSLEEFRDLAERAGLHVARTWTDEQDWFSLQYLLQ